MTPLVVITGASSGLGRLIARHAASVGAKLVLAARSVGELTEAAADAFHQKKFTLSGEVYAFDGTSVRKTSETFGTVNFLALDTDGRIASAVSTSGWAFKHPGRVGDSPLIGAGNYCDDRFGACACTGLGEWAIRASTARSVVLAMQLGLTLDNACELAFQDLFTIPVPPSVEPVMNLVALDRSGSHAGYSTMPGRTYVWQTVGMAQFEISERVIITLTP